MKTFWSLLQTAFGIFAMTMLAMAAMTAYPSTVYSVVDYFVFAVCAGVTSSIFSELSKERK